MNGKHPIDDLFARNLRDAEAAPPPAVWEGIVRERAKARPAPAEKPAPAKGRGRWGLAAILLLLFGAAGYWLVGQEDPAQNGQASVRPSPGGEGQTAIEPANPENGSSTADNTSAKDLSATTPTPAQESEAGPSSTPPTTDPAVKQADASVKSPAQLQSANPSEKPAGRRAPRSKNREANNGVLTTASGNAMEHGGAKEAEGNTDEPRSGGASTSQRTGDVQDGPSAEDARASKDERGDLAELESSAHLEHAYSGAAVRTAPDVHLPTLNVTVTPYMNSAATTPGPILRGDSTPAYVLNNGQWWIAAQAEWAVLNGEWTGTGPEVKELNTSETWRDGMGAGIAFGREWLSGWSIGLGLGVNKQRSRFLRREVEPDRAETVIDTTWTGSPLGDPSNYTWDIVQTVINEPGVVHDYSATNTYTRLRIAPEMGYRLVQKKRFMLGVRLSPMLMMDLGRKGNTLVTDVPADTIDTAPATAALPLGDASLDERFPLSMAVSAGVELRYRLFERWSVSALPTFTYWLPRSGGAVQTLSMNELGGALRLRYDLRHKERRVK